MNKQQKETEQLFSQRIQQVPRSFIRDILSVTTKPEMISFAGGLPNKNYFPVEEIKQCAIKVLNENGQQALQYSTTEGLISLRQHISHQYNLRGLNVPTERILITTGSQQALDLIGKVFINRGDEILIEEPAYLGAIQALSMYEPEFCSVPLLNDGLDVKKLNETLMLKSIKMAYLVPNFQNPSGITYSNQRREEVAHILKQHNVMMIEDDPYGAIRFSDENPSSLGHFAPEQTFMLGTFSKTVAPGLRIGWIVAPSKKMYDKLVIAKQASDLHSDILSQRIISEFLTEFDLEKHMQKIISAYKHQSEVMIKAMEREFPSEAEFTIPQGGMFSWVKMPEGFSSMQLFHAALKKNVAFVPGTPFYINKTDTNTFRLNFSCSTPEMINEGVKRIGEAMKEMRF